jgi:tetratricopeptide (TPR) repeat protein/predicted Ser/Thr protein kinase
MGLNFGRGENTAPVPTTEKTGSLSQTSQVRRFGDYELLEEIARGGMGVVYKARQVSLNRIVAVKMLLFGEFASDEAIKRFGIEAEAVASLRHPNIVALHEVGKQEGQHYFSMDYIEGESLAEALRAGPLAPRRAAALLKTIAEAIHYAHQRGILHRDIKPANILLDAKGEPHVTDFGLARLVEQGSSLTQTEAVLGTPNFMAPEQAAGRTRQVTTATDVFSLGAVFYQMLTGCAPFQGETAMQTLRQVLEAEPKRPRSLNPNIDDDLELICLKCLEKEPARRYGSAEGLAQDLARWLRHEPIIAAAPSALYKFRKFAQRHRVGLTSAATIVLLLVAGAVLSTWEALRARAAEKKALAQAAKSHRTTQFVEEMLTGAGPSIAYGRDPGVLFDILDKTAASIDTEFAGEPEIEQELRQFIGGAYFDLGKCHEAERMFRRALELAQQLCGPEHVAVSDALLNLGVALQGQSKMREAETNMIAGLAMRRKLLGNDSTEVAMALHNWAGVLSCESRFREAERAGREALNIELKARGNEHREVAMMYDSLAGVFSNEGKIGEADSYHKRALAVYRKLRPTDTKEAVMLVLGMADNLRKQGKLDETEKVLYESMSHLPKPTPDRPALEPPELGVVLHHLADLLAEKKEYEKARPLARDAVAMYSRHPDWSPRERLHALDVLAFVAEPSELADLEEAYRDAVTQTKSRFANASSVITGLEKDLDRLLHQHANQKQPGIGGSNGVLAVP